MRAEILDRSKRKRIHRYLEERYGFTQELDYVFLMVGEYLRVVSRDLVMVRLHNIKAEQIGLFFGEWLEGELVLSVEGSQLVGPYAKWNVAELDHNQFNTWMIGGCVDGLEGLDPGYVIVKNGMDYAGCGDLSDGVIWSTLPAHRRID